jgi:hypothetical protein
MAITTTNENTLKLFSRQFRMPGGAPRGMKILALFSIEYQ